MPHVHLTVPAGADGQGITRVRSHVAREDDRLQHGRPAQKDPQKPGN